MTEASATAPTLAPRRGTVRRLLGNPLAILAIAWLLTAIVVSIIAPWIVPHPPTRVNLSTVLLPVGGEFLLGTDSVGRDIFSRLLVGGRQTLLAGALAASVAALIGVPAGLVAGYYGGAFDDGANWVANALLALPGIVVLLAVRAAVGPNVWIIMVVFGLLLAPSLFRLTRTSVAAVRRELFVDAAKVSGLTDAAIIGRHVLWVVRAPVIIQIASVAAIAIAIQVGLDFLGLGQNEATWGQMVSEGFANVFRAPMLTVWPTIPIALTIASLVLFGNALRDALEDRAAPSTAPSALVVNTTASDSKREQAPVDPGALLQVDGLSISYAGAHGRDVQAVDDVSFDVARGEVVGIVGESGSGKTQTVFALLGLLPQAARLAGGRVRFDGQAILDEGAPTARAALRGLRGRRIAYVPQEPMSNLDPAFTVGYQLVRPMVKVLGLPRAEARRRAAELLEVVGIRNVAQVMRSYPHELSGGMAQRVLIAGAVSGEPDLLIADEPTTALDVTVQAEVLDLLRELQQRMDMAMLLVTHNFGVVADLCDRVLVMQKGRIVERGQVRHVLKEPAHPYTRMLLGSMLHGKTPMTLLTEGRAGDD